MPGDQRLHALPHLPGGFIGERHRQDRPSGHLVGAHQVGDPVRNDAGFAASGAGKDEKRAFGMLHRLALAGIQACEKIHGTFILAVAIMLLILNTYFCVPNKPYG